MRAHVHHHQLSLGRVRDRHLGDALALLDGLQEALSGSAADVHAVDSRA